MWKHGDSINRILWKLAEKAGAFPATGDSSYRLLWKYLVAAKTGADPENDPQTGDSFWRLLWKVVRRRGASPRTGDLEWNLLARWLKNNHPGEFRRDDEVYHLWKKILDNDVIGSPEPPPPPPPPSFPLTGLVAHWRLDEASGTRVDVHGGNDLTQENGVGQAAGKLGNAADFDAASLQSLSILDNAALSMGNIDMTIAAWVFFDAVAGGNGIVGKWDGPPDIEYRLFQDGSTFRFEVSGDGESGTVVVGPAVATGQWYFVVCWHDATANTINIQINNGSTASAAHTTGIVDGTASFFLGFDAVDLTYIDGRIDSVSIWKRVLTTQEKTDLYNGGSGLDYP